VFPRLRLPASWSDRILVLLVVVIVVTTGIVAWFAPPNTWDSLTYHMSRVAHWAQNRSLQPYVTAIEKQNFMSPGAEIAVLQVYVLGRGDRLANFLEWFAMVSCLIGVSLIARQLGARAGGQVLAVVFAATLPMGIAQASSTMTDYVVALWMVCVAHESLSLAEGEVRKSGVGFVSLAAGLAIITKPTAIAYLVPFMLYVAVVLIRQRGVRKFLGSSAVSIAIVILLNAGYLSRNVILEGTLYGGRALASGVINESVDWRVTLSNLLRNASLHAGTPFPALNHQLLRAIAAVHFKIGLPDLADPRTSVHDYFAIREPLTDENRAGNPLHALLILLAFALVLIRGRRRGFLLWGYAVTVASTFLVYSLIFKFDMLGSRYHLPFFVLFAPAVACALLSVAPAGVVRVTGLVLVVASWPWLVSLDSRPLLPKEGDRASIVAEPRQQLYLSASAAEALTAIANDIAQANCRDVGIMLSGDGPEYALWAFLGAPRDAPRVEWIVTGTPSARFADSGFHPCAIICDASCAQDSITIGGLPLVYDASGWRLYMTGGE